MEYYAAIKKIELAIPHLEGVLRDICWMKKEDAESCIIWSDFYKINIERKNYVYEKNTLNR